MRDERGGSPIFDRASGDSELLPQTLGVGIVGSFMDGVDAEAAFARNQHKEPAICIPPEVDRETVISKLAYMMGLAQGAADHETAAVVLGAVLTTSYPCK